MLKNMIIKNELTIGSWITLGHPAIAEIMANAGFDWLAIDLEHSVITIREAEELIRVIDLSGVIPLVRLTSNSSDLIKRVMDAGAHGVIVPMINTPKEAEMAVRSVKYPPLGERGIGLARAQKYGPGFDSYINWQESTVVIVQIEHINAVSSFREILSVPGIDGFIIGPYDLSASMGIPGEFSNPKFITIMDEIKKTANEMNALGGVHIIEPDPEELKERISDGYKFIAYSLDIRMLDQTCRLGLEGIK
jgi:2-dehydro-3-deoxyglucarate aldolase